MPIITFEGFCHQSRCAEITSVQGRRLSSEAATEDISSAPCSGWTIRPMFNQSSVSWYNRVRSLTTSTNRLNLTFLCVSQYLF